MVRPMDEQGITVIEAARILRTTPDAVRKLCQRQSKRLERAWKDLEGDWHIILRRPIDGDGNSELADDLVPTEGTGLMDVAQNVHLLIEMIRDQAEQIGMLKAELTASRQEVRALRATVLMLAKERAAEVPDA